MADGYQSVALGIKPADPNQAFNSINSILGMQQKRQDLQIQAQQLQQEQLKTEGQQGAAQYFQDFDPTKWVTSNGTTDVNGIMAGDAKFKGLNGVAKPIVMDQLQKMQGHQLENMRTLGQMDADTVTDFAQRANTWAQNPEVQNDTAEGRKYVQAEIQKYGLLDPQKAKIAGIYGKAFADPAQGGAKQGHLAAALTAMGAQAQTVSEQQAQSNPEGTTNAGGQIINRNRATGALSAAPTGDATLNPTSSEVAGRTARTTQVAGSDVDRANQVSAAIQPSQAAIGTTQRIDDLAEQISSGKFAKWVMDRAASLGVSDPAVVARQLLEKDLGQVKNLASSSAPTDKKMDTVLSGYPDATSAPQTIHTAMDYIRGSFRQNVARGDLLDKYRSKNPNLNGFQHADDVLTGHTDPLMHEFNALKTPAERIDFYKRNFTDKAKAQDFRNRVSGMSHLNVLGQ